MCLPLSQDQELKTTPKEMPRGRRVRERFLALQALVTRALSLQSAPCRLLSQGLWCPFV